VKKIRLLLADDHAVLRAGLRALLQAEPDMEIVAEAEDGQQALHKAHETEPDVVLMDLAMPKVGGLPATRRLKEELPEVKVLVLTMYDDETYLRETLEAGASGYVLKRAVDTELLSAIRAVHRGEVFLYPSLTRVLVEELMRKGKGRKKERAGYDLLSQRERQVLMLVAQGYTNQQIADNLFLSVKTVETYRARMMEKLGLRNRAELVRYALRHGLLSAEG